MEFPTEPSSSSILHTRFFGLERLDSYSAAPKKQAPQKGSASILVRERQRNLNRILGTEPSKRTSCKSGISQAEMDRLLPSLDYFRHQGPALVATIAPLKSERLVRDLARKAKSDLAQLQHRAGMRRHPYVTVWEAEPSCHPHIVAPFRSAAERDKAIASLNAAPAYLKHGHATMFAGLVDDWNGLAGYLLGEATQQAWWATNKAFRRVKGPHGLEGGGDRVIPSPDLKAALLRAGVIEPYQRTNASRTLPKPSVTAIAVEIQLAPVIEALPATSAAALVTGDYQAAPVQLGLFSEADAPLVNVIQLVPRIIDQRNMA